MPSVQSQALEPPDQPEWDGGGSDKPAKTTEKLPFVVLRSKTCCPNAHNTARTRTSKNCETAHCRMSTKCVRAAGGFYEDRRKAAVSLPGINRDPNTRTVFMSGWTA